jgi:translation initiation factor eIF-2B subunit alpha
MAATRRTSLGLSTVNEDPQFIPSAPFDVVEYYSKLLATDAGMSFQIAAIESLGQLIASSTSTTTTTELFTLLTNASKLLANASFNSIGLSCGTDLFLRFVSLQRPPSEMSFERFKAELVQRMKEFVEGTSEKCRRVIAENCNQFITDGSVSHALFPSCDPSYWYGIGPGPSRLSGTVEI